MVGLWAGAEVEQCRSFGIDDILYHSSNSIFERILVRSFSIYNQDCTIIHAVNFFAFIYRWYDIKPLGPLRKTELIKSQRHSFLLGSQLCVSPEAHIGELP